MERHLDNGEIELVTILRTSDKAAIAVAKSILEGVRIDYYAKNELLIGRHNIAPCFGGIELQVSSQDAEEACLLLKDLIVEKPSESIPPFTLHDVAILMLIIIGTIAAFLVMRGGR